jgi:branched-chain amino acid transport system permease protein
MGLINFAQGEFAMFTAFICFALLDGLQLPYAVAVVITVVLAGVAAFCIERLVVRPFERGAPLVIVIVTLALFNITNSVAGFVWGYSPRSFPSPFPARPIDVGGILISIQDAAIIGVCLLALGLLYVLFNRTRLGLAMRAAAANPESARLVGIRVGWMTALGWGMAAAIGAVAGMLIAPVVFLEPNMMLGILLYGFAGAVLGGLSSPGGAVLGGFAVGVVENLAGTFIPYVGRELKLTIALVLIVAVLMVKPSGLFGRAVVSRV